MRQVRLDVLTGNVAALGLFESCGFRGSTLEMLLELEKTMGIMLGTTICGLADGTAWATRTFINKFYDEFAAVCPEAPIETVPLFREDAYLRDCEAKIISVNDRGGIILDRTVFYATSGGQPGDTGHATRPDGSRLAIAATILREHHTPGEEWLLAIGRYHRPAGGAPAARYRHSVHRHLERVHGSPALVGASRIPPP